MRPSFLPPDDGSAAPAEPAPAALPTAAPVPSRGYGAFWDLAMIAAAATLLVAAFLPWARAEVVVDLFGRPISRDLGSAAGIDADDLVVAVPALAVVAIAMAFWDLVGRDARIGGLAAVPAVLALLACGLFVLRLGDVRDDLPDRVPAEGLDVGYQVSVRYGWYLAVAAALVLIGCSLARPISDRVLGGAGPAHGQRPYAWSQDGQRSGEYGQYRDYGEYAVWPQPNQAAQESSQSMQEPNQAGQEPPPGEDDPSEDRPEKSWPKPD